ncbi:MAG: response regulator transcription factor [bacterium]
MSKPSHPKPKSSVIRVALIDDHTLLRETMTCILNAEAGLHVVGDAAGRIEGMAMIAKQKPAVVIQDICIGRDNGLEMLQEIKAKAPDIKCLVLTGFTEDDFILQAIQYHADGYLLKSCSMPILVNAIRQVASGHKIWDESVLKRLTDLNSKKRLSPRELGMDVLTPGEQEISRLVADGLTNREIGKQIHLAEKTIRNRVSLIMDKIHISRRSKLAALYTENLTRPR